MAKILSIEKHQLKFGKENIFKSLWNSFLSLDTFTKFFLITIVLITVATPFIVNNILSLSQYAAVGTPTATINAVPSTGTYEIDQQFTVDIVIDGGGQAFNAAQATVAVTGASIVSLTITPAASGGCNFTFVNQAKTPSASDLSFAGAILNGSLSRCTLYTITLQPTGAGTTSLTLTRGKVKDYATSAEILLSMQDGSYTIGLIPSPTPTTGPTPTISPTPIPTNIPSIPPPTNTPTPVQLQPPIINLQPTSTYQNTLTLTGTKLATIVTVFVNNSTNLVTYPTATTWQFLAILSLGTNTFTVYGTDSAGNTSGTTSVSISLQRLADINGDTTIDLTDLSMFATDWENTGTLNYALSDINSDGVVDLTDFSILAKTYEN